MDDNTFEDLYKRYVKSLRSYVINQCQVPEADADDVVHNIFGKFWKKGCNSTAPDNETSLLLLMTKNIVGDYWRKQGKNKDRFININFGEDEKNNISAIEEAICNQKAQQESHDLEILICLQQVFAQIEDNSDIYLLNCLQIHQLIVAGHTTEDIATQIDRTAGAIRQHISQCRKKLKQYPPLQECWDNGSTYYV